MLMLLWHVPSRNSSEDFALKVTLITHMYRKQDLGQTICTLNAGDQGTVVEGSSSPKK